MNSELLAEKEIKYLSIDYILPKKAVKAIRSFEGEINTREDYFIYHITGNAQKENAKIVATTFVPEEAKQQLVDLYKQFASDLESNFCYTIMLSEIGIGDESPKEQVVSLIETKESHFISIADVYKSYSIPSIFFKMDSIKGTFSNILR
jgi:hypothetical protein